jgi:nucleotide-binding universal stress UspA family protein
MHEFSINQALVCFDLSDSDEKLSEYLNFITPKLHIGSLFFLHVIKKPDFLSVITGAEKSNIHSEFVLNEDILKLFRKNIESKISNLGDHFTEYEIQEGSPANKILEAVEEHHADLVVIGKKSGTDSNGFLLKSLSRHCKSNLLIVPTQAQQKIENIFVAIDFSENSGKALQKAIQLNYQLNEAAKISCFHVYEMPDLSYYKINKTYDQLRNIIEADMNEAFERFLEKYAPDMGDMIQKKSILRTQLSTAGQLVSLCDDYKADLVIMGAKGHSAINSFLIGSITEKFIQMNEKSAVLIVR